MHSEDRHLLPFLVRALRRAWRSVANRVRRRPDSEAEQALIRVVLGSVAIAYMLAADLGQGHRLAELAVSVVAVSFLLTAVGLLLAVLWSTDTSPLRRCIGILVDLSATSVAIAFAGEAGAPLLAVYLWVIVGNGFRYGNAYLGFAAGVSILGLGAAVLFSPFWRDHLLFSASFLLVFVLIPGYMAALLAKLRAAIHRADEANQAKSQFLAKMSHELRTPLNGIIGVSDLLQDGEMGTRERELVGTIQSSGAALLGIIDEVLDFSQIEAGHVRIERTAFSVARLVRETLALFRPQAERKGIELSENVDGQVPSSLVGDPLHIRQVLMNLVMNAIKFTDEGHVRVRVAAVPESHDVDGTRLRFEVADSGSGIEPEEQARIFESFHQTRNSAARQLGGVGLGAAIARELVQRMGGTIGLESAPGQGSMFWFELPLARAAEPVRAGDGVALAGTSWANQGLQGQGAAPTSMAVEPQAQVPEDASDKVVPLAEYYRSIAPASLTRLHILVAEDNATNRDVLCAVLRRAGHQLTVVEDGEAALDALQAHDFDLMILDNGMPGRTGLDVFRTQRFMDTNNPIPTLILSADATEQAMMASRDAGVDAYLTKPVASRRLLDTIARLPKRSGAVEAGAGPARGSRPQGEGDRDEELLDGKKLQSLLLLCDGPDDDFLNVLLGNFERDAQHGIDGVAGALAAQDYPALRDALHALEGSARELGATGLVARIQPLRELKPYELGSSRAHALLEQLRGTMQSTSQLLAESVSVLQRERAL